VRVPITPQIVSQISQIKQQQLDQFLREIPYFSSTNITFIRSQVGEPSLDLDTYEGIQVLTFRDSRSSLDCQRITTDDKGRLGDIGPEDFKIQFPDQQIILVFTLNRETNWFDLKDVIDETTNEPISQSIIGTRPHLMTNYQAFFNGETHIQTEFRQPSPNTSVPEPETKIEYRPEEPKPEPSSQFIPAPLQLVPIDPYMEEVSPTSWGEDVEPKNPETAELTKAPNPVPAAEKDVCVEFVPVRPDNFYIVQIGAYREKQNVDTAFAVLERAGFRPLSESCRELTRVLIPAVELADLAYTREKVKDLGFGEPYVQQYRYIVQVGAYQEKRNADAAFTVLEQAGLHPFYEPYRDLTRVFIPAMELARTREKVKGLGFSEPYVRR
jgi:cell division septation protein DedD